MSRLGGIQLLGAVLVMTLCRIQDMTKSRGKRVEVLLINIQ